MKKSPAGFTLVETVIATGILLAASVTIASMFVSTIRVNLDNRDRTGADLLLADKIEQLAATAVSSAQWTSGDYSEYVSLADDGRYVVSSADSTLKYRRAWQISGTQPKTVTVIIYSNRSAISGRPSELIRATLVAAARW